MRSEAKRYAIIGDMQNNTLPSSSKTVILDNYGPIAASLYVAFQIIANILAVKIAIIPFTTWAVAGGTIIYPFTFTLRDFVHKTLGKKQARQIVVLAVVVNVVMALCLILVGKLTPAPLWGLQEAYEKILLPVGRIALASIIAQIVSELVDTEIFSWSYKQFGDVIGVLVSNTVSIILDSFLFVVIAFYGTLPVSVLWQIIVAQLVVKFVLSLISSPTVKLIPRQVEMEKI